MFELREYLELYRAGSVQRYHTEPAIVGDRQTNGNHQWGVAMLILALHPDPSLNLVRAALGHDLGERVVGDVPHPGKHAFPALREMLDKCEDEAIMGRPLYSHVRAGSALLPGEDLWLRGCDYLEACFYLFEQRVAGNTYFDDSFFNLTWTLTQGGFPEPVAFAAEQLRIHYGSRRGFGCGTNTV